MTLCLQTEELDPAVRPAFRGRAPLPLQTVHLRDDVERALAPGLQLFGLHQAALGLRLWRDYQRNVREPAGRPETLAAATVYALVRMIAAEIRQAEVASTFGVSAGSSATRFAEIREALRLKQFDRRYIDDRPAWRIEETMRASGLGSVPDAPL